LCSPGASGTDYLAFLGLDLVGLDLVILLSHLPSAGMIDVNPFDWLVGLFIFMTELYILY
jgi:hypothetical protein